MNNDRIKGAVREPPLQNEPRRNRRSIRLQGYDYSQAGAYFITICAQSRECLFGDIVGTALCGRLQMVLNDAGRGVGKWWGELNHKFPTIETDEYIVMPNHFHGIIVINVKSVGADLCVCPETMGAHEKQPGAHAGAPLPKIVQWFKTMTTNEYIRGVKSFGWPLFSGRLWQRNYYEHIIRDENELNRVREYIVCNPAKWALDRENPMMGGTRTAPKKMEWETS